MSFYNVRSPALNCEDVAGDRAATGCSEEEKDAGSRSWGWIGAVLLDTLQNLISLHLQLPLIFGSGSFTGESAFRSMGEGARRGVFCLDSKSGTCPCSPGLVIESQKPNSQTQRPCS